MPGVKRSKVADEERGPSLVEPPPDDSERDAAPPSSPYVEPSSPSIRVASPPEDATVESAPQTPSVASTDATMESVPSHVRFTESTNDNDALEQCMEILSPDLSPLSDVHIDNPFGANDDPNNMTLTDDDIKLCLSQLADEDDRNKLENELENELSIPRSIGANDHYIDELANMDEPPSRRSTSTPSTTPARRRAQHSPSTKRTSSTHRPSPLKLVDPNRIDSQHPSSGGGFSDTEWKLLHMTSQVSSERLVLTTGDVRIALLERGETCASLQGAARRRMRLAHAGHGVNSIPHIVSDAVDKEQVHIVELELDRVRDIIPTIVHFDSDRCSWLHEECMSLEEHREKDTVSTMEKIKRLCDDPNRVFVDNKNRRSDMCCSKILDDFRTRAKKVKRIHVARMDMVVSTDDGNTASVTGTPFVITNKRLYDRLYSF